IGSPPVSASAGTHRAPISRQPIPIPTQRSIVPRARAATGSPSEIIESIMDCYHLPVSAISHLITQPIGRLGFVFTPGEHALPYTALDYFDHSLRRSNRLLLETEATYELIGPEGRLASQAAERKAGFIAELPD